MAQKHGDDSYEKQIEHRRVKERPDQSLGRRHILGALDQLGDGNGICQSRILNQGDDLIGERGNDALDHLLEDDLEKDLCLAHTKHVPRLVLTLRYAFNTAAEDLGEIAGVIDHKGDEHRQKSAVPQKLTASCGNGHFQINAVENIHGSISVRQKAGQIIDHENEEHQRNTADDPDKDLGGNLDRPKLAHGAKRKQKSQGDRKKQGQGKEHTGNAKALQKLLGNCQKVHNFSFSKKQKTARR